MIEFYFRPMEAITIAIVFSGPLFGSTTATASTKWKSAFEVLFCIHSSQFIVSIPNYFGWIRIGTFFLRFRVWGLGLRVS
jgi:hypothetical protein